MPGAASKALGLAFALLVSGCVSGAPASPSQGDQAQGSLDVSDGAGQVGSAGDGSGRIFGTVVDDEQVPMANVSVSILEIRASLTTEADGIFEFLNVPVGSYTLTAAKPGYEAQTKRVEIEDGATATPRLHLVPLQTAEAYVDVLHHTALHVAEASLVTWGPVYYQYLANGTLPPMCESCRWTIRPTGPADGGLVLEILGRHAVASPYGTGARETWYLYGNNTQSTEDTIAYSVTNLPMNQYFRGANITKYAPKGILLLLMCDTVWFCVNERREIWASVFHHEEPGDGYTAVKKG